MIFFGSSACFKAPSFPEKTRHLALEEAEQSGIGVQVTLRHASTQLKRVITVPVTRRDFGRRMATRSKSDGIQRKDGDMGRPKSWLMFTRMNRYFHEAPVSEWRQLLVVHDSTVVEHLYIYIYTYYFDGKHANS